MKKFLTLSTGAALFFSTLMANFAPVIANNYSDACNNSSAAVRLILPKNFSPPGKIVGVEVMIFPNLPPPTANETAANAIPAEITPDIPVQLVNQNIYLVPAEKLYDISFFIHGLPPGLYSLLKTSQN
ncbi:MAG: hypothetical protein LBJ95_01325 [Oscillospiraceae bacterium]|jgi:hypothetical protein|nr:hypothetical protein [Oscillospiraceae bacterium]